MKKKSEKDLAQYWRWEFLRLNDEYRKDYDRYKQDLEAASSSMEKYMLSSFFVREYGISAGCDYRKPLPKGVKIGLPAAHLGSIKDDSDFHYDLTARIDPNEPSVLKRQVINLDLSANNASFRHPDVVSAVQVVIRLDAKMGDIKRDVQAIVSKLKNQEKTILKIKLSERSDSKNLKNYRDAYKMHKKRYSNKRIAEKMGVKSSNSPDPRFGELKVKNFVRAAKKLVDGGYRRIVV